MMRPWWQWLLGWLGFAALLATLIFYGASGLLASAWQSLSCWSSGLPCW